MGERANTVDGAAPIPSGAGLDYPWDGLGQGFRIAGPLLVAELDLGQAHIDDHGSGDGPGVVPHSRPRFGPATSTRSVDQFNRSSMMALM